MVIAPSHSSSEAVLRWLTDASLTDGANHVLGQALRGLPPCRLKHIIEQYADGPGVLLELVQNADDAGASEISFLLDSKTYASNSVLGKHHHGHVMPWHALFDPNMW